VPGDDAHRALDLGAAARATLPEEVDECGPESGIPLQTCHVVDMFADATRNRSMGLEGRVALVTGGGRGIGRAISLALAEDGADVAVNYSRHRDAADETVAAIEQLGRKAIAYGAAVESAEEDAAMVESVLSDFGKVDILVNNAGIASRGKSVKSSDPEEVARVVGIHAIGPHHLCRLVLPSMREQQRGDIVFISSIATDNYSALGAPYAMGKAAEEALAFCLAKEESRNGIHVNVVAPGLVDTEMGKRLVKGAAGVEDIRTLDAAMPFGHVCQPEDVANVVRWFCSEGASYVTGQRVVVHGGGQ
jgi:NAD(P)-dependent dehydrogenase (short-subunit alcohol dehydrogenase family)